MGEGNTQRVVYPSKSYETGKAPQLYKMYKVSTFCHHTHIALLSSFFFFGCFFLPKDTHTSVGHISLPSDSAVP